MNQGYTVRKRRMIPEGNSEKQWDIMRNTGKKLWTNRNNTAYIKR